jgi:ligand-binding sensor domain-containing protein
VKNDSSGWKFIGGEGRGLFNDVNSFAFMEGRAFFGSIRGTLFVFDGVSIERATDTFFPANIFSLAAVDSRIYVGTGRGLYTVENKKWEKVGLTGRFDSSAIFDIFTGDGYIILGTKDGIVRYGARGAESLSTANGLPFNRVNAVLMHQGTIYAGTPAGLVEIKGW